jgi:hypothetical protein
MKKPQPIFYEQMTLVNLILSIVMLTGIIRLPSILGHVLFWVAIMGLLVSAIATEIRSKR